jgi:hypothetical protein
MTYTNTHSNGRKRRSSCTSRRGAAGAAAAERRTDSRAKVDEDEFLSPHVRIFGTGARCPLIRAVTSAAIQVAACFTFLWRSLYENREPAIAARS